MMFRSIRSRLMLSFVGIALVAAGALGGVLLAILQNYYLNLELAYLRTNAEEVGGFVVKMTSGNVPHNEVQSQIEILAFLTQTRIQVFSPDNTLLYDSGSPQKIDVNLSAGKLPLPEEAGGNESFGGPSLSVSGPGPDEAQFSLSDETPSSAPGPKRKVVAYSSVEMDGTPLGLTLNTEPITGEGRSNLELIGPLRDPRNGNELGKIKRSEGPAYGTAIITSVARGGQSPAPSRCCSRPGLDGTSAGASARRYWHLKI